jgi:hypothetical protein
MIDMNKHRNTILLLIYIVLAITLILVYTSCASHSPHSYKYPKHM